MGGGSHLGGRGLGLVCKIPNELWEECRGTEASKARTHPSPHGALSLTELTLVRAHEKHIDHLFHSAVQKGWVRPRLWPCLAVHCSALGAQGGRRARLGVTNAARSGRGGSPTPADCRDCRPACCGRVSRACAWAEGSVVLFPVASAHLRTGGGKMGEKPPPPPVPKHIPDQRVVGDQFGSYVLPSPPPPDTHTHTQTPDFTVLGETPREALPAPAREGRRGAEAAPVCRGTTAPLSFPKRTFPLGLGASHANSSCLKPKAVCTSGSANRHTYAPAFNEKPRMGAWVCALSHSLSVCVCVCVCARTHPKVPIPFNAQIARFNSYNPTVAANHQFNVQAPPPPRLDAPGQRQGQLPSSVWTRRKAVKQGKSGGSVGITDRGKGKGSRGKDWARRKRKDTGW